MRASSSVFVGWTVVALLTVAGAVRSWGPGENRVYFDLLLGLRYWDLQQGITIGGNPAFDASDSWADGMIGGRILVPMAKKWWFSGRLDAAGWNGLFVEYLRAA